jgi:hypothetical protein
MTQHNETKERQMEEDWVARSHRTAIERKQHALLQSRWHGSYSTSAHAVVLILCNEWFSRIWIIQEAAFAKRLILKHGREEIEFDRLLSFLDIWAHWNLFEHGRVALRLFLLAYCD